MQDKNTPESYLIKSLAGDANSFEILLKWLVKYSSTQIAHGLKNYFSFPKEHYQDITQEVLITFHQSYHSFDQSRPFIPWINAIIKHKLIDFIRRKDFSVMMNGVELEKISGNLLIDESNDSINKDHLDILLSKLAPIDYQILMLSKMEGYSNLEISKKLNISLSNIKVRMHRALKFLKKSSS